MAQKGTDPQITPRQGRFIHALLGDARSIGQAAIQSKVSRRQAERWLKMPHVQQALRDAQEQALQQVSAGLLALSSQALDVLGEAMRPGDLSRPGRIRAAEAVLSNLLRIRELVDLEKRLSALEGQDHEYS